MSVNIWNKLFLAALLSTALFACKTRKKVVGNPPPVVNELSNKKAENIKLLKSKDLVFNTLAVKAKAKIDIGGSKNSATMNIRMEKGRRIWVSITALAGIEVARALITPDSVKVRNNFQSVYLKKPFSYLHRYANKQISFDWLESILSGNTIADFVNEKANIEEADGLWVLDGEKEKLAYKVFFDALMKVNQNTINDVSAGQALKVVYAGPYQDLGGSLFPKGVTISSMAGTRNVNIELEYSGAERNVPLEFPFSVPGKYEVIN
ncbi:DUF4292 domain-containing protein [Pedobacter nyackensis]|uniref:DUF4292 domain-containing protein n=1 Tax=Pedobacter nyackensis TaxID=475255 RepID=UPI00292EBF74|nr:DUF4292 domain-containing protein [Pedobacter nyackensis]